MKNSDKINPNLRILAKIIIPLSLLIAGIMLLFAGIAGWSIIFGLPLIVIGVVFSIYTYDEVSQKDSY